MLVDANVLYPKTLRDWLALLYSQGGSDMFTVYWTDDILTETAYHLRRDHALWEGRHITTIIDQIRTTFEVGRVEDYSPQTDIPLNDPHDAHVHAAAIACSADIVLTHDSGFRDKEDDLPYVVYTADEFFLLVDQSNPGVTRQVIELQQDYWVRKHGEANLVQALKLNGCPQFAERVREHQTGVRRSKD